MGQCAVMQQDAGAPNWIIESFVGDITKGAETITRYEFASSAGVEAGKKKKESRR